MTNEMLQANDSKTTDTRVLRLLVAMEMSLKTWRLAMAVEDAVQETARDLHAAGFIDKRRMREYDAQSIPIQV